jgi:uncharacterized protein (DUF305 family)
MIPRPLPRLFLLALLALPLPAAAQQSMPGMDMPSTAAGTDSSTAFKAANDKMMKDMAVPLTGDTDRDFVAGMIPHHAGAIDMAEIELKDGKDPAMKKLARDIIAAQKKEIALMKKWQAAHAK